MIVNKKILISVGTTQFEGLIQYTDSEQFLNLLKQIDKPQSKKGQFQFENFEILTQIGNNGKYIPKNSKYIRLSNNISQIYAESDFIICHGGAGTLLQNLHNGKKIIAVANNTLAGNHQTQLINKLVNQGYLIGFQSVQQLKQSPQTIRNFFSNKITFKKYQRANQGFINTLVFGRKQI